MAKSQRPLFRETALKQYMQRREKDIIPQRMTPAMFRYTWIGLALLLLFGLIVWSVEVPHFITVAGVITEDTDTATEPVIVLFIPMSAQNQIQDGAVVRVSGGSLQSFTSTVMTVGTDILSPREIRQQYHLDEGEGALITEPMVVAVAQFPEKNQILFGSVVTVQVQIGNQRLITLFVS